MKKLIASLGLGVFALTSFAPATFAAQETVFGTMDECLDKQAELAADFEASLRQLQKTAKNGAREQKLTESFRKRLARMKKITPEMQKVIDEDQAWDTELGASFEAYFGDWVAMLDGICSTSPATVKGLWVSYWEAQVELAKDYVAYLDWLEANLVQYKKTVPAALYRKAQKSVKGRAEAQAELDAAKATLAEANALSTTSFEG